MEATINWQEIYNKLPYGTDAAATAKRHELFSKFDPNGNGLLSLAEVDKAVRDLELHDLFDAKPVLIRAWQAAKDFGTSQGDKNKDYVDKREFRILLQYIFMYMELWAMYEDIDTDHSKTVDLEEFKKVIVKLAQWGKKIDNPDATFRSICRGGDRQIMFQEFADWAISEHLDLKEEPTPMSWGAAAAPVVYHSTGIPWGATPVVYHGAHGMVSQSVVSYSHPALAGSQVIAHPAVVGQPVMAAQTVSPITRAPTVTYVQHPGVSPVPYSGAAVSAVPYCGSAVTYAHPPVVIRQG